MIDKLKHKLTSSPVTTAIIVLNIVIFVARNASPLLADQLALYTEWDVIMVRPWSLLTVFFSHDMAIHLVVNMGLLFIAGIELEKIAGGRRVLLIYLLAGLLGSLTFPAMADVLKYGGEPVVGASAAAFGTACAYAVMRPQARVLGSKAKSLPIALFAVNAIIFVLQPEISVGAGAHAVGIVVGSLYGYWLKRTLA